VIDMPNPLFNALVGGRMSGNGPLNMLQQFQKFKQDMQGKNPKEEVSRLLQSGKINQQQLNQIQQMARQLQGILK
jgi:hypothetical protein